MQALIAAVLLLWPAGGAAAKPVRIAVSAGSRVVEVPGGKVKLTGPGEMLLGGSWIELKAGRLLLALPRLKKRRFEVRTANAVAAVRGTEFYVEASPSATYLCVCEGAVRARPPEGRQGAFDLTTRRAKRHAARELRYAGGRFLVEDAGMRGHDDAEFPSLRAR